MNAATSAAFTNCRSQRLVSRSIPCRCAFSSGLRMARIYRAYLPSVRFFIPIFARLHVRNGPLVSRSSTLSPSTTATPFVRAPCRASSRSLPLIRSMLLRQHRLACRIVRTHLHILFSVFRIIPHGRCPRIVSLVVPSLSRLVSGSRLQLALIRSSSYTHTYIHFPVLNPNIFELCLLFSLSVC